MTGVQASARGGSSSHNRGREIRSVWRWKRTSDPVLSISLIHVHREKETAWPSLGPLFLSLSLLSLFLIEKRERVLLFTHRLGWLTIPQVGCMESSGYPPCAFSSFPLHLLQYAWIGFPTAPVGSTECLEKAHVISSGCPPPSFTGPLGQPLHGFCIE